MTIATTALGVRFGDTVALDDVTCTIPANRITALLGRNGAGKTSLMTVVAGLRRPTTGTVTIDGVEPFESAAAMADTVLVRDRVQGTESMSVKDFMQFNASFRPRWDQAYADELLERFGVPQRRGIGSFGRSPNFNKLSKGQKAAALVAIGLASRASVTMFDEPHVGLDAPTRYAFYDELMRDYARHPRTIILSTHVIDEITRVIEDVLIIDRGRVLVHDPLADLQTRGAEVTGPADDVDAATFGRRVLSERQLGNTKSVVVYDELNGVFAARAAELGVDVGPLPLQDLFVHLTAAAAEPTESEMR